MTQPTIWPRAYLLSIYSEAIKHGFVWVEPLTEAQATSLRLALYRLRRRSDSNNREFITPEHKLVTVGQYDHTARRLPILFSRLPDMDLPTIRPATEDETADFIQMPEQLASPTIDTQPPSIESIDVLKSAAEITLDEQDITSYVEKMKRRAVSKEES